MGLSRRGGWAVLAAIVGGLWACGHYSEAKKPPPPPPPPPPPNVVGMTVEQAKVTLGNHRIFAWWSDETNGRNCAWLRSPGDWIGAGDNDTIIVQQEVHSWGLGVKTVPPANAVCDPPGSYAGSGRADIDLPDYNHEDDGESWFCRRRRWC